MKNQRKTVNTNQFVNFVDLIYNFNEEVKGFTLETKCGEYYSEIMNINNKDVFIMIPEDDGIPYSVAFDDYFFDILSKIIEEDFEGSVTILSLIYKKGFKEYVWHNAKEDPPKDGVPVLVTYLGYYDKKPYNDGIAYIANGKWHWKSDEQEVAVEITHWTELPEIPKSHKNKN